jgi:hypothetical protein
MQSSGEACGMQQRRPKLMMIMIYDDGQIERPQIIKYIVRFNLA